MRQLLFCGTQFVCALINTCRDLSFFSILVQFQDVFDGEIGRFEGKLHLHADRESTPVKMPCRKWLLSVKKKVKDEIKKTGKIGGCQQSGYSNRLDQQSSGSNETQWED